MEIIKIENLSFSYNFKIILNNISLCAHEGESICIVGMSGLGKSTLLKLICDLPNLKTKSQEGFIKIKNINNKEFIKLNKGKIGFLFQSLALLPNLTVEENIKFPSQIINRNINSSDLSEIIKKVGLENDTQKYIYELSGGMKTRVALASILLSKPEILLLDEPFGSLDIAWKFQLYKYYFQLKKEFNTTNLIVTHDIQEAITLSDKIYILLKNGTLSKPHIVNRQLFDLSNETNYKSFLKQNNDLFLNIQETIIKDIYNQ